MTNRHVSTGGRSPRSRLGLRLRCSAAAALLSVLGLGLVATAPAAHADLTFDQQMLTLINQDRAANGVGPLQSSPVMAAIAEDAPYVGCGFPVAGRAADMGNRNYFSHTIAGCGTRQVFDMLTGAGLPWTAAAENIGWEMGTTDPAAAAQVLNNQFMASSGHRANILDPNLTHVGVGSWHTGPGQTWSGSGSPKTDVYVTAVVFARLPVVVAQVPSAATGVVANPGRGQLDVSWRPAAANGAAVDTYVAYAMGPNGYTGYYALACGTCTSVSITGLTNGSPYWVLVYAHNAVGWGPLAYSQWVYVGTPLAPAPATATGGGGQATASWAVANGNGTAVDAYAVLAYDASGYTNLYTFACATCTRGTVTALTVGHAYYFQVFAHNALGWSPPAFTGWVTA
jgi:uncharacterized protein YkwD